MEARDLLVMLGVAQASGKHDAELVMTTFQP
jgi:hypothetical protein